MDLQSHNLIEKFVSSTFFHCGCRLRKPTTYIFYEKLIEFTFSSFKIYF